MPFSANNLLDALPRLRRYARILTDDTGHADRLVEVTVARARQMQGEPAFATTPGTQLLALLRSVYAEQFAPSRSRWALPPMPPSERCLVADEMPSGSMGQSLADRGADMLAQLFRLPLEQREIIVLVAVERMSYDEIATLLGMPVATVMSRLSQAREALRSSPSLPVSTPKNAS